MYCIRGVLEKDSQSSHVLEAPKEFVREPKARDDFRACVRRIVDDMVGDLNDEIDPLGDNFDYRDKMRDTKWVTELSKRVVADHMKLVRRGKIESLGTELKARQAKPKAASK